MFTAQPIGFVSSPYTDASEIPKDLGAKHEADGVLKILPQFEPGLTDIECFSHLIVIWEKQPSTGPRRSCGANFATPMLLASIPPINHQSHDNSPRTTSFTAHKPVCGL